LSEVIVHTTVVQIKNQYYNASFDSTGRIYLGRRGHASSRKHQPYMYNNYLGSEGVKITVCPPLPSPLDPTQWYLKKYNIQTIPSLSIRYCQLLLEKAITKVAVTSPISLVFLPVLYGPKPVQYHHHCETLHRFEQIGKMSHLWSSPVQIEKKQMNNVAIYCSRHMTIAQWPLSFAV
jgi:hypothetical protein